MIHLIMWQIQSLLRLGSNSCICCISEWQMLLILSVVKSSGLSVTLLLCLKSTKVFLFKEACCYLVKNKTKQKSSANLRVARLASNRGNVLSIYQMSAKSGIEKKQTQNNLLSAFSVWLLKQILEKQYDLILKYEWWNDTTIQLGQDSRGSAAFAASGSVHGAETFKAGRLCKQQEKEKTKPRTATSWLSNHALNKW